MKLSIVGFIGFLTFSRLFVRSWKFDADRVIFRMEVASAEEAFANGLAVGGQVNEVMGHHCNYFWVRGGRVEIYRSGP